MQQADVILVNEDEIDQYRGVYLEPLEILVRLVPGRRYLFNAAPGVGKTEVVIRIIGHPATRRRFNKIAYIASRRDLLDQVAKRIPPGVTFIIYPDLESGSICHGEYDERLPKWHARGYSLLIKTEICDRCPAQSRCRYSHRSDRGFFDDAYVVLLTEQLIKLRPDILERMGFDADSLIVVDECNGADAGYVTTFDDVALAVERHASGMAGVWPVTDLLHLIQSRPGKRLDTAKAKKALPGFQWVCSV